MSESEQKRRRDTSLIFKTVSLLLIISIMLTVYGCKTTTDLQQEVSIVSDLELTLSWKNLNCGYIVEYLYPEFDENAKTLTLEANSCKIERKRGTLKYRVQPDKRNYKFGDWKEFNIEPIYLGDPENVRLEQSGVAYNVKFDKVKYKASKNEVGDVSSYEFRLKVGDVMFSTSEPWSYQNLTEELFNFPKGEEITIQIRALNYTYSQLVGIMLIPKELYELYEINTKWKEFKVTL